MKYSSTFLSKYKRIPFFSFRHLRYTDGLIVGDANSISHCIISFGGFGGEPQSLHFDYLIAMTKNTRYLAPFVHRVIYYWLMTFRFTAARQYMSLIKLNVDLLYPRRVKIKCNFLKKIGKMLKWSKFWMWHSYVVDLLLYFVEGLLVRAGFKHFRFRNRFSLGYLWDCCQ